MVDLTVLFNTYPVAFDCPGGGEVQLLKYMEALNNLGVETLRYDPWCPHQQFDHADIAHYFSVQSGSWRFNHHVREIRHLPLVVSPIVWIDNPEKYCLDEIKFNLSFASHILPNSHAECEQLSRLFQLDPKLFTPIVNGVDEVFFEPAEPAIFRAKFNIPQTFVLCMGNIEARKNQLRLIESLKGTGLHLVLAGQEREADYARQCRQLADDTVHFIGSLEHGSQVQRSAYAAAEVLALPSTLETPGLAALEAAAAGCRLAITSEGCTKEYFKDYAAYLDPYNNASILQAIQNSLLKPKDVLFPSYIRKHFTWKEAAKQLIQVYTKVIDNSRCRCA